MKTHKRENWAEYCSAEGIFDAKRRGKNCRRSFPRRSQFIHQRIHYNSERERRQRRLWAQLIALYVGQLWKVFEEKKIRLQHYKRRRALKKHEWHLSQSEKNLKKKGKGGRPNASVPLTRRRRQTNLRQGVVRKVNSWCFSQYTLVQQQSISGFVVVRNTAICVEAMWIFDKLQILRNF